MDAQPLFGRWCEEEPPLHTTNFEVYWKMRLLEAELLYEEFMMKFTFPMKLSASVAAS